MKGKASVKVDDGKLVKVEVKHDENIEDVEIRGDFFLQPPEALYKLEEALIGLENDASRKEMISSIEEVDAELIGFSADDIVDAAEKAIERSNWRIINEDVHSEAMHHALDELLVKQMHNGEMRPTIRFWHRENPAVPIGRFQSYEDEVQSDYVEENDIEVVRRVTGGGAMYAEPEKVITYSLYMPEDMVPEDVEESYQELDRWAVETLRELGLDVEYRPLNDIEHEDGKVGGAAQLRRGDAVLHHTMLSYDLDTRKMLKALRIGEEKVSDKAIQSAEKRVAVMNDYINYSREQVIDQLIKRFQQEYGGKEVSLDEEELDKAEKLAEKKFSSDEWNRKL